MTQFFIHHTIAPLFSKDGRKTEQVTLMIGPYNLDEVLAKRLEVAGFEGATDVHISERN